MTDDELKNVLKRPDAPDLDIAARERIVTSAAIRYRHAGRTPETQSSAGMDGWWKSAFNPMLAAAAVLVLAITIALQIPLPPGGNTNDSNTLATDRYNAAVFSEYQVLFQDDLRAVVARNGDVNVVLGGQATQQTNPLVIIRIEHDGEPVFITAYSGQTIEAEIGGENVTLDILTTTDQDVVLASDEFILDRGVLHGASDIVADAHVLEVSL